MADLRMPDVNKVTLAGRLTRDPELRYTSSGTALCKMGLAVSRFYKGRDGERKEETTYLDVTAWDKQAEYLGQRLRQGSPVFIEGSLKQESWEDKQTGQKRSKISVTARRVQELSWSDRGPGPGPTGPTAPEPRPPEPGAPGNEGPVAEDDIPF